MKAPNHTSKSAQFRHPSLAAVAACFLICCFHHPSSAAVATWYGPAGGPVSGWDTGTDSITWSAINSLNGSVNTGLSGQLDFVGNTTNSGAYFANYGGYLFFRMRVNVGTVTPTTFSDSHLVLIDILGSNYPTNGQTGKPDLGVAWDSKSADPAKHGEEMMIPATLGTSNAIWRDISMDDIDGDAGKKVAPPDINTTGQGYIRTIDGQAAIGTNNTTFIDFAVARSYLNPIPAPTNANPYLVNILNHDFRLQFASIANATDHNKINGDVAGPYTLDSVVTNSWSDPLSAHLDILWTGAQSNNVWDITSTNWRDAPNGLNPTAPDLAFISGDDVWFGNQAASNSPITVSTNIIAGTMTVTNTTGTVIFRSNSLSASSLTKSEAGNLTFSNSLALYGTTNNTNGVFLNTGSGNIVMAGALTQGELRQSGTGTITLSVSNSYTGGTTISNGLVTAGANGALGSGFLTVAGGTLGVGTTTQTVGAVTLASGSITGSGTITGSSYDVQSGTSSANFAGTSALIKSTAGTVTLTGTNSYSGGTAINAGRLEVGNGGSTGTLGGGNITNNATLVFNRTGTLGVTNFITGTGELQHLGLGTLTLSASNNFSGPILVRGATNASSTPSTLVVGNQFALGNVTNVVTMGAISNTGAATLAIGNGMTNYNPIFVNPSSSQQFYLRTLAITNSGETATQLGTVSFSNSQLALNVATNSTLIFGAGIKVEEGVSSFSRLVVDGGGTVIVTNSGSALTNVTTNNTWQVRVGDGTMIIGSGSIATRTNVDNHGIDLGTTARGVQTTNTSTLLASNGVTVANSVYVITSNAATRVMGIAGTGTATYSGTVSLNNAELTLSAGTGGTAAISGNVVNYLASTTNSIRKTGAGTVILSGTNTYKGATTIAEGTLQIDVNSRLGNTNTTTVISNGGTLRVTSAGGITNAISIGTGNGTLANGSSGTVTYSGAVTNNGTTLTSSAGSGTNVFTGVISGTGADSKVTVNGGTTVFSNQMTYTGPTTITNGGTLALKVDDAMPSGGGLILGGGTFLVGDASTVYADPNIGTMTLTANSTINLGTSTDTTSRNIVFASSSLISWVGTLTITNWTQMTNSESGAYGRIYFGTDNTSLTAGQLSQIKFDIGGTLYGAKLLSDGELVLDASPIPEPGVVWAAAAILMAVAWNERKRFAGMFKSRSG